MGESPAVRENYSRFPESGYGKNCHHQTAQCVIVNSFRRKGLRDAHLAGANKFHCHENEPGKEADKAEATQWAGESHETDEPDGEQQSANWLEKISSPGQPVEQHNQSCGDGQPHDRPDQAKATIDQFPRPNS